MLKFPNGVYVGCGLTQAPEAFKASVERLKAALMARGYQVLEFVGTRPAPPQEVYNHDIKECVGKCDAMLAIVDYPSLGLGWELAAAGNLGIPTLAVAQNRAPVSRLILGAAEALPSMGFERYGQLQEVPAMFEVFLAAADPRQG